MTDDKEPNGYELQRSLDGLRKTMEMGLTDIKVALTLLVSRDLFDSELRRQDDKFATLDKAITELHEDQERRSAKARWAVAAIFIPLLTCLIGVISLFLMR